MQHHGWLVFAVFLAVFHAVTGIKSWIRLDDTDEIWAEFKKKYNRQYSNEEDVIRRAVFGKTVKFVNEHNVKYDRNETTFRVEVNQFADMTEEEGKISCEPGTSLNFSEIRIPRRTKRSLPKTVDWVSQGFVTSVKNQGNCRSCWAFGAAGALEGLTKKTTGKLVSLSEQQIVDCAGSGYSCNGCNGGSAERALYYVRDSEGLSTSKCYPYNSGETKTKGSCRVNELDKSCFVGKVGGVTRVPTGERNLQEAVANVGPISVRIGVVMSFMKYKDGIYDKPDCIPGQPNHAVVVVGYGETATGQQYWKVKNSYGSSWGEQGYIRIARNNNRCGIADYPVYPTQGKGTGNQGNGGLTGSSDTGGSEQLEVSAVCLLFSVLMCLTFSYSFSF